MTSKERILAHLDGQPVDHLPLMPITMMFAADLIGTPYRKYCTDFKTLAEGQIRTAEQFGFDYVNTMSDPAREAADCGAAVEFFESTPVALVESNALLANKTKLASLKTPDPLGGGRMHNGVNAVAELKKRVGNDLLVEGWIEGPIAEAADLRGINTVMLDFFDDPTFIQDLFEFVVDMELRFAKAQLDAGADLIGIGDAAASLIGPRFYKDFVWPYEKKLIDGIHAMGGRTRLHICGNTSFALKEMGALGCAVVDLDYPSPIQAGRHQMGPNQILLGNVNPVKIIRDSAPDAVTQTIRRCHQEAGPRFIVGAGCEIPRDTPHANLQALCQYAHHHHP